MSRRRRSDVTTIVRRIHDIYFFQVIALTIVWVILGFVGGFSVKWLVGLGLMSLVCWLYYFWRNVLRSAEPDMRRKHRD